MSSEWMFRVVLVVGLLTILAVGLPHRLRARTGERLDRRQEGLAPAITLRLVGLGYWLGLLCYIIRPEWMAWGAVSLPAALRWTGAPLGVTAICLIGWTLHHLGPNLTDTVVTRQRHTLITSGPYRFMRHPFYASAGLWFLASSLLAANVFLLAAGATGFGLLINRTRREEANLLARFGDEYRRYQERTGRILPKLTR
jgi:protein-S-isoprenylcysteine O-methyltransferase Ste14